jgi:uncharacterized lipoprotein YehR (DUF1307 family)
MVLGIHRKLKYQEIRSTELVKIEVDKLVLTRFADIIGTCNNWSSHKKM